MPDRTTPPESDFDQSVAVTALTLIAAREAWRRYVKRQGLGTFLAPIDPTQNLKARDINSGARGSQITRGRAGLDIAIDEYAKAMRREAEAYQGGGKLSAFALNMARLVTEVNSIAALAALAAVIRDPIADVQLDPLFLASSVLLPLEEKVDEQATYLWAFVLALGAGAVLLDGNFFRRSQMYAEAARGTYYNELGKLLGGTGITQERRVLGVAEHCVDCVEYAGRGWQPLGSLPVLGDSRCLVNCRCTFEYR